MRAHLYDGDTGGMVAVGRKAARRGRDPSLRTTGRQAVIRGNGCFRHVCRGRIVASRADYPLGCVVGVAAAGGMPPLRMTRYVVANEKLRAGHCPAPAGW